MVSISFMVSAILTCLAPGTAFWRMSIPNLCGKISFSFETSSEFFHGSHHSDSCDRTLEQCQLKFCVRMSFSLEPSKFHFHWKLIRILPWFPLFYSLGLLWGVVLHSKFAEEFHCHWKLPIGLFIEVKNKFSTC